jgi:hypothetical protein
LARRIFFLLVMLVVAAAFPASTAGAGEAAFPDLTQADILPGFGQYLEKHPLLLEGGGVMEAEADGEWLALGVGRAVRRRKDQTDYELWKAANAHALAALAGVLEGTRYSGTDAVAGLAENGRSSVGTISVARRETEGVISGSREAGRWRSRDGEGCFILRAVLSPGHPLRNARREFAAREVELDPAWREEFLSRPFLRNGGVDLLEKGRGLFILAAGAAPVKGASPAARITAVRVAEVKARAELLSFCQGMRVSAEQEAVSIHAAGSGGGASGEMLAEKLSSRTDAQLRGLAGRMRSVGGWLSADGRLAVRAYVADVDDL